MKGRKDFQLNIKQQFTIQAVLLKLKHPKTFRIQPYIQKAGDAGDISPPIFWIFRQILG